MINMAKKVKGISGYTYHLDSKGKVVKMTARESPFYGVRSRTVEYIPCEYTRGNLVEAIGVFTPKQLTERLIEQSVVPYHAFGRLGIGRVDDHAGEEYR